MFQYPGKGLLLTQTNYPGTGSGTQPEPTYPLVDTLTANQYSNYLPIGAGQQATLTIVFASAPPTATTIQIGTDPTFTDYQETTIPSQATTMATWQSTHPIMGLARVKNTSGVNITAVWGQTLVNTHG